MGLALLSAALGGARVNSLASDHPALAALGYRCAPLQRSADGHLHLRARLNGHRSVTLVDTGWSFSTLAASKAKRLFKLSATAPPTGSALIQRVELGKLAFRDQPVRIEPLLFHGQPASFECVLGLDFLRRHFALLDCGRGRLYLRHAAPSAAEVERLESLLRQSGYSAVTLRLNEPPALTCLSRVNGQDLELLVDSAAVWSVLDAHHLERLKLRAEPTLARLTGAGNTGTRPVLLAEPRTFELEHIALHAPRFAVMNLADWDMAAPDTPLPKVGGILGAPELRALEAWLDCHGLKLWVRAPRSRR